MVVQVQKYGVYTRTGSDKIGLNGELQEEQNYFRFDKR